LRIGVVVNDVASVNVDARLVAGRTSDLVELQNGCACCSLADELYASVEKLLDRKDGNDKNSNDDSGRRRQLDAIVVELSGVADPVAIKSNWRTAPERVRKMADVARIVTLVDAGTFGTFFCGFGGTRRSSLSSSSLSEFDRCGEGPTDRFGSASLLISDNRVFASFYFFRFSPYSLSLSLSIDRRHRLHDMGVSFSCFRIASKLHPSKRTLGVCCGSVYFSIRFLILLFYFFKRRLRSPPRCDSADSAAREREGWTEPVDECSGNRQVAELLAEQVESADLILVNKVDLATKEEVLVASSVARALNDKAQMVEVEYGRVSPKDLIAVRVPPKPAAKDVESPSDHHHSHSHDHDACVDPGCADASHSHSHDHACDDPDSTDSSHSHSHDHACEDQDCTDPSHSHSHDHGTSMDKLGIKSFVFRAAVPFSPRKLMNILNKWPIPVKDTLDIGLLQDAENEGYQVGKGNSPFAGVLRSKGFCWFAPSKWSGANEDAWRHDTAMYWSHAGKHFSVTAAGKWWGTITKDQMQKYFTDNVEEYDRILREDFVSDEFGDRRQEIVFIGTNLDEDKITKTLNDCLLGEKDMTKYRQKLQNYLDTITTTTSGSLFDVGTIDHLDAEQ